jgi:hypothetical protein
LVSCGVVQGDTLQKTHRPIRKRTMLDQWK